MPLKNVDNALLFWIKSGICVGCDCKTLESFAHANFHIGILSYGSSYPKKSTAKSFTIALHNLQIVARQFSFRFCICSLTRGNIAPLVKLFMHAYVNLCDAFSAIVLRYSLSFIHEYSKVETHFCKFHEEEETVMVIRTLAVSCW